VPAGRTDRRFMLEQHADLILAFDIQAPLI
jgi:hypothetical protein